MATIVDSLIVTLGLDASKFKQGASDSESKLLSLAKKTLIAVGAFQTLKKVVTQFVSAGDEIGRFANLNGMAVEQVQSLDNVIKISGGNVGQMRGTIEKLNKDMNGLYPVNPFAAIGVRATDANNKIKPMTTILTEVAGKMEGMRAAKQADIGKKLGLDESTIVLLQKGRAEVSKLFAEQKELGQLTKDDTKIARQMNEAIEKMKIAWAASGASIARVITPAITWLTDKMTQLILWMRKNDVFVKAFFSGMATVITVLLIPSLLTMGAAVIAATWPLILIGLAIAGVSAFIALLIDDYKTWKEGGKSAFGDTWKVAEEAFTNMMMIVQNFWDFTKQVFGGIATFIQGIFDLIVGIFTGDLDKMSQAVGTMMDGLKEIWSGYADYVGGIIESIVGLVTEKFSGVTDKIKAVGEFFGFGGDEEKDVSKNITTSADISENISASMAGGASASIKPSSVQNNSQQSSSSAETNIGQITVQTAATDAPGIANDLGDAIRDNGAMVNQAEGGLF